jgi:hypothetical protein
VTYTTPGAHHVDHGDQVDPAPPHQHQAQPAERRRPIEERILLPVRKTR